jgi:DNA-binding winged helix-turn-helix (wHTH) protein
MQVRFGSCVLDTDTREVRRDERPIHLTPLAFRLLELLITHRPRALTKSELQDTLWPGVFVTEASLSSLVADLRSAIGDEARGATLIRTVHRHGYAFAGDAQVIGVRPAIRDGRSYRLIWLSREISVGEGETILGRSRHATIFIDDESVSRRHARITIDGGSIVLEDLGSKNGTTLNGQRLGGPAAVTDGAHISVGSVAMIFRVFDEPGSTITRFS